MPTTRAVEAELRELGWFPSASQPSLTARRWVHSSDLGLVMWVQRGRWMPASEAAALLEHARAATRD